MDNPQDRTIPDSDSEELDAEGEEFLIRRGFFPAPVKTDSERA